MRLASYPGSPFCPALPFQEPGYEDKVRGEEKDCCNDTNPGLHIQFVQLANVHMY